MKIRTRLHFLSVVILMLGVIFSTMVWGAGSSANIGDVAGSIFGVGLNIQKILKAICIVAGVSLILASLLQYKKHRQNPVETTWGTVIFTFVIGVAIICLAFIPMSV